MIEVIKILKKYILSSSILNFNRTEKRVSGEKENSALWKHQKFLFDNQNDTVKVCWELTEIMLEKWSELFN